MITKLDLYKIFCMVGKHNSFSKASQELYMSQPAVSQSIKQLELEIGTRLFTRTPKGVNLTNEGKILYEYVSSAISLIDVGEQKLLEVKNLAWGDLKIGVGDTISRYYLMPYLEEFHQKYPNIKFKIINRTTLELCELLKTGEVDIAICNLPIDDQALESRKCMDIHDVFVCGEKYKELLHKELSIEDIRELPLILLEPKSNSRKYVEKHYLEQGVQINPEIELGSHDLLLEFAKINLGIACVVREFSKEYLNRKDLHEIKLTEEIPPRSIGICFLKGVTLSHASTKFVEILNIK